MTIFYFHGTVSLVGKRKNETRFIHVKQRTKGASGLHLMLGPQLKCK